MPTSLPVVRDRLSSTRVGRLRARLLAWRTSTAGAGVIGVGLTALALGGALLLALSDASAALR